MVQHTRVLHIDYYYKVHVNLRVCVQNEIFSLCDDLDLFSLESR